MMMGLSEIAKPYYSAEDIAAIIQDSGYSADVKIFDGCTVILSSARGICFSIYLYGEREHRDRVTNLQFSSSFGDKITFEQANKWNRENRFLKAYVDDEGDLCLEWDVVVTFVPPGAIKECLIWWEVILSRVDEI
jgi:hypothetical protein